MPTPTEFWDTVQKNAQIEWEQRQPTEAPRARLCPGKVPPSGNPPTENWYEPVPGFFIPNTWGYYDERWPRYDLFPVENIGEDESLIESTFRFRDFGQPDKRAWGAWFGSYACDRPLNRGWGDLEIIADRMYEQARYKFLIPAWRAAITKTVGDLDDIEDQITTILWILEWISKKVVPLPPRALGAADELRRTLDCAEKQLAGVTPFRVGKSEHANCLRSAKRAKLKAATTHYKLLAWFRDNWGRMLEAAQASNQWFDVGIVLGPLMGFIEQGMWGLAQKTMDNYLIAVDAVAPGYREDFNRNAEELSKQVSRAWDDTWEGLREWNTETIENEFPGFFAP